jgi:hypothetical protein
MIKLALTRSALAFSLVLAGGAVGCGVSTGAESTDVATLELASDGNDAVQASDQGTIDMTDATFDLAGGTDATLIADALVAAPGDPISGKCRSRAKDPSDPHTVIITLTHCTGRFGNRDVSGTEIVHFTMGSAGVIHADFHSENLTAGGQPASHTATADITVSGTTRTIAWQGAWERTNDKDVAVLHTSDLTITVDTSAHCRTRNGTSVTHVGAREIHTTITDLKVCRDENGTPGCPTGEVVHVNQANGKTVTVDFDGSHQAAVTTPKGETFDKAMTCGG